VTEEEEETEHREKDAVLHNGPTASLFDLLFLLLIPSSGKLGQRFSPRSSDVLSLCEQMGDGGVEILVSEKGSDEER